MFVSHLMCHDCGETHAPEEPVYRCGCGGALSVVYDYRELADRITWEALKKRIFAHYRYQEFYPVLEEAHQISLDEGGTPLIPAPTLSKQLGLNLYLKLESQNPTGSFKDRGTAVEIGKALDFDADEVVVASTGNMGSSIAAYAARAGIEATIYIPQATTGPKRKQMESYGANLIEVEGGYEKAAEKAYAHHEERGTYLLGDYAYRGEGEKSVGFEIVDQLEVDVIVTPIGNGTLLHGVWKGLVEFEKVGLLDELPRMVGVQAEGCNTVVRAFKEAGQSVTSVGKADTVASAIACENPLDGVFALDALRESRGDGFTVSDKKILEAKKLLAEKEGVYAEEAGAVALAGIIKHRDEFDSEDTIVLVVTGHGLKS